MTYQQRQELINLSKEVFGRPSFWNKLFKTGVTDKTTKKQKYFYDFEEIKAYILEVKANTEKLLEDMKAEASKNK